MLHLMDTSGGSMKIIIYLILFFYSCLSFAQDQDPFKLFEKNYLEIDPFFMEYENVTSSVTEVQQNNVEILTSRPSVLIYMNYKNYILNSSISINPRSSKSNGSLALGRLYHQIFEFGLTTTLNHIESVENYQGNKFGPVNSQFMVGPYVVYYPSFMKENSLQIYFDVGYLYIQDKVLVQGTESVSAEQRGVQFDSRVKYSYNLNDNLYYSPSVSFGYAYTVDSAFSNTTRQTTEFQIVPISFQIIF